MKKHKRKLFLILGAILLVFCFFLLNLRGYRILQSRTFRKFYDRIDFKINTKELKIPEDALAFSVYDMNKGKYLFYEGGGQLPTVASLSKLFAIDYALTKVKLEDTIATKIPTIAPPNPNIKPNVPKIAAKTIDRITINVTNAKVIITASLCFV